MTKSILNSREDAEDEEEEEDNAVQLRGGTRELAAGQRSSSRPVLDLLRGFYHDIRAANHFNGFLPGIFCHAINVRARPAALVPKGPSRDDKSLARVGSGEI